MHFRRRRQPTPAKRGFFKLGWMNNRTQHEKTKTRERFVFVENEKLSIIPVLLADQYLFWCVNHRVRYLQGEFLWLNFFESFQHVTISFKVDSTLYHLIHVTFLKSYIIWNLEEPYVHFTLKRNKTAQLLTKLEMCINVCMYTNNAVVWRASLWSKPGQTRPGDFFASLVRFWPPWPWKIQSDSMISHYTLLVGAAVAGPQNWEKYSISGKPCCFG